MRLTETGLVVEEPMRRDILEAHDVMHETDRCIVLLDTHGYEITEIARDLEIDYSDLVDRMHELADEAGCDQYWSTSWPIVISR